MLQERRRTATFFGLGSAAIVLMVGAGITLNSTEGTGGTKPVMHPVKTFQAMERPDPVLLLTPVQLPDHMFAKR